MAFEISSPELCPGQLQPFPRATAACSHETLLCPTQPIHLALRVSHMVQGGQTKALFTQDLSGVLLSAGSAIVLWFSASLSSVFSRNFDSWHSQRAAEKSTVMIILGRPWPGRGSHGWRREWPGAHPLLSSWLGPSASMATPSPHLFCRGAVTWLRALNITVLHPSNLGKRGEEGGVPLTMWLREMRPEKESGVPMSGAESNRKPGPLG